MVSRRREPATQPGGLRDICNAAGGSMKSTLTMLRFGKKKRAAAAAKEEREAMARAAPSVYLGFFDPRPGEMPLLEGHKMYAEYGGHGLLAALFTTPDGKSFDRDKFNKEINRQYDFAGGKTILHIAIEHLYSRKQPISGLAAALSVYNLFKAAKNAGAEPIDIFNQADGNGDTPLHYAARLMARFPLPILRAQQPLATFLTALFELHKAGKIKLKPYAENKQEMTPMHVAEMLGNELAIEIFTANGMPREHEGMKPNMVTVPALKSDGDAGYDMYKVQSYGETVTGWSFKGGGAPAPNKIGFGDEC